MKGETLWERNLVQNLWLWRGQNISKASLTMPWAVSYSQTAGTPGDLNLITPPPGIQEASLTDNSRRHPASLSWLAHPPIPRLKLPALRPGCGQCSVIHHQGVSTKQAAL